MERLAAGLERVQRALLEREARAAVLHQYTCARQDAGGAELPIERLNVGDDEAGRIRRAHPDRVALAFRRGPARRLAAVDLHGFGIEEGFFQVARRRMR